MAKNDKKLNKEPYKGVRDFYPKDKFIQNYIFEKWSKVAESFGYEETNSSILEPTELYESKTGEEIVNEQTYSFDDRGDRRVTLRPEMTPSVARMVAQKKRELAFPLRWFSIANFFRYERPQRGRGREFYQLNCDLFGIEGVEGDLEIIKLAYSLMKEIGADDKDFEIRINNRKFVNFLLKEYLSLSNENSKKIMKLIDKKDKMSDVGFELKAKDIMGDKLKDLSKILNAKTLKSLSKFSNNEGLEEMTKLFDGLKKTGIKNFKFEPTLMRGLDYYTGTIFEIWDTGKENNRSLFGGGRYDNLLEIFGEESIPTVGFAVSDVVMENYMETYKLLPKFKTKTDLLICTLKEEFIESANTLAGDLREQGINVIVNLTSKKVGDQISFANKKSIPFVICIGKEEIKSGQYKVKDLKNSKEKKLELKEISEFINLSC